MSIVDRSGRPGIYIATDVEGWLNGHGYWRPFVVEFEVDDGGEMFIPAVSTGLENPNEVRLDL